MSFISVIKAIGKKIEQIAGVGLQVASVVETAAEPIVAILDPLAEPILEKIQAVTAGLEGMITGAQQGAIKGQTAVQILDAEIPQLQAVITAAGSNVKIPQQQIQDAVNASVASYNALAAIVATIKAAKPAS